MNPNKFIGALLGLSILTFVLPACSSRQPERFHLHPWEKRLGYAQSVKVGEVMHISGIVSEKATFQAQLQDIYATLGELLDKYHLSPSAVVKETVFTTEMDAFKTHNSIRSNFYGAHFPASTWVQVERLYNPSHRVEVEFVVAIPE